MTVGSPISYTTLIGSSSTSGSVANWLNHSAVQASADNIVYDAEATIYRSLRHWRMLSTYSANTVIGNDYLALPADYLEDKILYITGQNFQKMYRKTMEETIASYSYDGSGNRIQQQPMIYFSDSTNFKFDSACDAVYPVAGYYYAQPASLFTSGTNWLTQFYPRLLRCACVAAATEFMKDVGAGSFSRDYWVQMFQAELAAAQMESDRSVRSMKIGMVLE